MTRRRKGRVEAALDRDLSDRPDVGPAERAALRVQAQAVDLAADVRDPSLVTEANRGYLDLRKAAGITVAGTKAADPFDDLLAALAEPEPGLRDTPNA